MFELWARVSRSAREHRKAVHAAHGPREQAFFKKANQDSPRR
jgi:hypothetical protein